MMPWYTCLTSTFYSWCIKVKNAFFYTWQACRRRTWVWLGAQTFPEMLESIIGFHKWHCAVRGNVAKSYYETKIQIQGMDHRTILSRHVLTVLLSLAGWLQNGCHSEKRTAGYCSSEVLSILKIKMIDESHGVTPTILPSFLLSSTDSNPLESTTFYTVWSPQLHCLPPACLASHHAVTAARPLMFEQKPFSANAWKWLDQLQSRADIFVRWVFGKINGPGLPLAFTKIGNPYFFWPLSQLVTCSMFDARLGNWDVSKAPALLTDVSQRPV